MKIIDEHGQEVTPMTDAGCRVVLDLARKSDWMPSRRHVLRLLARIEELQEGAAPTETILPSSAAWSPGRGSYEPDGVNGGPEGFYHDDGSITTWIGALKPEDLDPDESPWEFLSTVPREHMSWRRDISIMARYNPHRPLKIRHREDR